MDNTSYVAITTYNPTSTDSVYLSTNLSQAVQSHTTVGFQKLFDTVWCNQVDYVPQDKFGFHALLTSGGFLVPGKSTGSVSIVDISNVASPVVHKISDDKSGYFYHHTELYDMNGDGLLDIVAARALVPTVPWKSKAGEFVWFEQPKSNPWSGTWTAHTLVQGPDVSFIFTDLDGDDKPELVATQFFTSPQLVLYWCEKPLWSECGEKGEAVKSRVIDSNGPYFTIEKVDLNGDGIYDFLVSNNEAKNGSLFAYEVPKAVNADGQTVVGDIRNGSWGVHLLGSGYAPKSSSIFGGKGAPGNSFAACPQRNGTDCLTKPVIVMSGDDAGLVSVFHPKSQEPRSWDYEEVQFASTTGTIGTVTYGDANFDGSDELYVPFYSDGLLNVYTFDA